MYFINYLTWNLWFSFVLLEEREGFSSLSVPVEHSTLWSLVCDQDEVSSHCVGAACSVTSTPPAVVASRYYVVPWVVLVFGLCPFVHSLEAALSFFSTISSTGQLNLFSKRPIAKIMTAKCLIANLLITKILGCFYCLKNSSRNALTESRELGTYCQNDDS